MAELFATLDHIFMGKWLSLFPLTDRQKGAAILDLEVEAT